MSIINTDMVNAIFDMLDCGYDIEVWQAKHYVTRIGLYAYQFTLHSKHGDSLWIEVYGKNGVRQRQVNVRDITEALQDGFVRDVAVLIMDKGKRWGVTYLVSGRAIDDTEAFRRDRDEFISVQRKLFRDKFPLKAASWIVNEADYSEFRCIQTHLAKKRVPECIAHTIFTIEDGVKFISRFCVRTESTPMFVKGVQVDIFMPDMPSCNSLQSMCMRDFVCNEDVDMNLLEVCRLSPVHSKWERYAQMYNRLIAWKDDMPTVIIYV